MTNRRYRVLYVENANSVGGSIISIYRLVQKLNRQRYEPIVLFHRPNAYESCFRDLGIEVIVLRKDPAESARDSSARPRDIAGWLGHHSSGLAHTYRRLKSICLLGTETLPQAWQIRRVIETHEIDLVHLNNLLSSNRSGALAAGLAHVPCLCHVRGFGYLSWFDQRLARSVSYFAFVSRALEDDVRSAVPALQGSAVYDGLELESFLKAPRTNAVRSEFGLDDGDFVVGNVGRLVAWKGQVVFLRALASIAPQVPNLKALIVGDPDPPMETGYLQRLLTLTQELGLSDLVRFTGFYSDIPAMMASLDVLVHSSSSPEPFGIVVIEGMAAGKPVIATRAGGVLDIIEDGTSGLLVPVGDEQAMAEAILTLARNREAAVRLGAEARQRVAARFTVTQYAQTMQTIYNSLLGLDGGNPERIKTSESSSKATMPPKVGMGQAERERRIGG